MPISDLNFFLICLTALQTKLFSFKASDPLLSLFFFLVCGNKAKRGNLSLSAFSTIFSNLSTE